MAFLVALAPYIGLATAAVGAQQQSDAGFKQRLASEKQASLARISGEQQQDEQNQEALQLEASAKSDRASSERQAADLKRQSNVAQSRAMAIAAASGGNVIDPSVINILSGFSSEGDFAANTALFNGDESARGKDYAALVKRQQGVDYATAGGNTANALTTAGKNVQSAGNAQAGSTILSGVSSFAKTYK